MKYVCSFSGGKDSCASVLLAHLYKEPLDKIVFSEVMFDLKNNISGENPDHIDFIWNRAKPLFESWGYEVRILRAENDYLSVFNRVIKSPRKHAFHKGMKYGFCVNGMCSVKRDLKLKPLADYYKTIDEPITQYVGIAIDEPARLAALKNDATKISLLEKYNYTEQMAKELCKEYNLLSPCYDFSKRGGCWMCPNAKRAEHRQIRSQMPDVWQQFVALENEDNVAHDKWNVWAKETLHDRDRLFAQEDISLSLF